MSLPATEYIECHLFDDGTTGAANFNLLPLLGRQIEPSPVARRFLT
jgi:hypothetical protein